MELKGPNGKIRGLSNPPLISYLSPTKTTLKWSERKMNL